MIKKFLTGVLTLALALSSFAPIASALSPAPYTYFGVGVNDFPDHEDYNDIENIPYAYVNVYVIDEDSSGTYEGTLVETAKTDANGGVDVLVYEDEMVNFLGFLSYSDATSSDYKTYDFTTPPYKNFGTGDGELCQTHFFQFDEFLNYSENYACTTGLSTPYTVVDNDDTWHSAVTLESWSDYGTIYNDWSSLKGLGSSFDYYKVMFKKGYYSSFDGVSVSESLVTWNYYDLADLNEGDWWSFQVVPVKWSSSKGKYVEVGDRSKVVPTKVIDSEDTELTAPYIYSPWMDQVLTNYPREANLEWSWVEDAYKYEIEVACDVCSSTTTKWQNPSYYYSYNNWYTTPALAGDNEFRFRVRAIDDEGTYGPWSSYSYFRYDTSGYATPNNEYELSLSVVSWDDNGLPKVNWTAYSGDFDGYAMFVREGWWDENQVTWEDPAYFSTSKTSHQMVKMKEYTTYTVRILPYEETSNSKKFIYPGSNTLVFTTGADDDYTYTDQDLPPAGYEDDVLTGFDVYKNPFPDTSMATLEGKAAAELYRRAIIGGFPDGEFKGYREVNRAELAKFLLLARYGYVDDVKNSGQFSDVLEGEWYVKFVVTAAMKGIIDGYSDGTFRPADTVNVAEFLKMLSETFDLSKNMSYHWVDVDSDAWYAQYAGVASEYDLFPNSGNYLNPSSSMTRNEVAVAIYQYLLNR